MNEQIKGVGHTLAVIIPAYNAEKYLEECVYSVLRQPCKDLFVVLINDGSTDSTKEIAHRLMMSDDRISVIDKSNGGVSSARNAGLDFCEKLHPEYVAFLDSDDVWVNGFYTEELRNKIITENKEMYHFSFYFGNESLSRGKYSTAYEWNKVIPRFLSCFWTLIYQYNAVKDIRFPIGIRVQEDEAFKYLFLCTIDSWSSINKPMYIYRSNSHSVSHDFKFDITDKYFKHILPAWDWVETELKIRSCGMNHDVDQCLIMKKTYIIEYIEMACRYGISIKAIRNSIEKSEYYNILLNDNVWCDSKKKSIWEDFLSNPFKIWFRYRIKQIIFTTIYRRKNNILIQKIRYPTKFI